MKENSEQIKEMQLEDHKCLVNEMKVFFHNAKGPLTKLLGEIQLFELTNGDLSDNVKKVLNRLTGYSKDLNQMMTNAQEGLYENKTRSYNGKEILSYFKKNINSQKINIKYQSKCHESKFTVNLNSLLGKFMIFVNNSIQAEAKELEINYVETDKGIHVYIKDNGFGMNSEVASKCFDKKYSTKKDGQGMGLRLVKEFLENNNWEIVVNSVEKVGTTFEIIYNKTN